MLRMEVVVRPEEVGRHCGDEIRSVLLSIRLTSLDACYLGHSVGFIGRFQLSRQKCILWNRLGSHSGINARAAQKQQFLHAHTPGFMEDVCLNQQIFSEKFGREGVVGVNASDLRGCQEDILRALLLKKPSGGLGIGKIQFFSSSSDQVLKSFRLQCSQNRRAYQSKMTGNINSIS